MLRTTGKNLLVIKLQTDQIYIILYMYKEQLAIYRGHTHGHTHTDPREGGLKDMAERWRDGWGWERGPS